MKSTKEKKINQFKLNISVFALLILMTYSCAKSLENKLIGDWEIEAVSWEGNEKMEVPSEDRYFLQLKKSNGNNNTNNSNGQNFMLSITENGYGKRTSQKDFRLTNRGGKGIIGIVNSKRNGNTTSSFPVFEGDEIVISTNKGRIIRTLVKEIRIAGRNTQGVRIIKLSGDEKVVSAFKIDDNLL